MKIAAAILGTILSCVGLDARNYVGMTGFECATRGDYEHIAELFNLFRGQRD